MWKVFLGLFVLMAIGGGIAREYNARKWDGIGRFTIIEFLAQGAEVRSIDPLTQEAVRITLPGELQIQTAAGRGEWRIEVLKELAKKNSKSWAGDSIANFLGIAYTAQEDELSWWDRIVWKIKSRNVIWTNVPLAETTMVAEALEVDDEKVLGLDSRWGKKAREYFAAADLTSEGMQVVITNATSTIGLGAGAARIVDSSGIRVIMVQSMLKNEQDKCELKVGKADVGQKSVKYLVRVFNCDVTEAEMRANEIELILGLEYAREVYGL